MKVIDYDVFRTGGVRKALLEGWQPWGSAYYNSTRGFSMQPMVKYDEDIYDPSSEDFFIATDGQAHVDLANGTRVHLLADGDDQNDER